VDASAQFSDVGSATAPRQSVYRRGMLRWLCASVVAAVVSGFAVLLVTGRYAEDGPVVASVSSSHGVHEGDVFVLAGWALSMVALAVLTTLAARRDRHSATAARNSSSHVDT
jgi:hypothetical protein